MCRAPVSQLRRTAIAAAMSPLPPDDAVPFSHMAEPTWVMAAATVCVLVSLAAFYAIVATAAMHDDAYYNTPPRSMLGG
jgi:hypothetical protein